MTIEDILNDPRSHPARSADHGDLLRAGDGRGDDRGALARTRDRPPRIRPQRNQEEDRMGAESDSDAPDPFEDGRGNPSVPADDQRRATDLPEAGRSPTRARGPARGKLRSDYGPRRVPPGRSLVRPAEHARIEGPRRLRRPDLGGQRVSV